MVVDATFEHRVSDAERDEVRTAMLNGEIISPPAGAIGRGDAFVLRIAERTGATVLSNDSFQEFHGEHPWLFDDGRLIGGKPVPGVGWIFTPRLPIRGPKSRAATAEAKAKKEDPSSAPAKAAELARAAKKADKRAGKAKKASKKASPAVDASWPITPTAPPPRRGKVDPVVSSAIEEALEEVLHPPAPEKPRGSAKKQAAAKKASPQKSAKAKKDASAGKERDGKGSHAKAETATSHAQPQSKGRKKRSAPPPAVNEPLAFINFVADFAVGSTIDGEVVSFTSHGAMVDVSLPGGGVLHCYIPLSAMGKPPPTKARQVLKKGELRPFVLAGLDPSRRVAELTLPVLEQKKKKGGPAATETPPVPVTKAAKKAKAASAPTPAPRRGQARAEKAAKKQAKKAAPAKKAPARAAPAKKATKSKQAGKATPARAKAPAKKSAATPAKRVTKAKKAPAKKASKGRP